MKEVQKVLDELKEVRPEKLTGEAKRLFEAIMKIADERDELLKERQADKEKIKELEADNYECNNIINDYIGTVNIFNTMINLMLEEIVERKYIFGTIEQAEQYFENKAKESGEIDDK